MPIHRPLHLAWPNCHNVRDLGGTPVADGQVIGRGALIRSDNLNQLTAEGVAQVRAVGVSRVVDLRPGHVCRREPTPFTGSLMGVNCPVQDQARPDQVSSTLIASYRYLLDTNSGLFAAAVRAVVTAPPGAVVLHCHSGKDRSGLVVALILAALGADSDTIAADYVLSRDRIAATFAAGSRTPDAAPTPVLRDLRSARQETIVEVLRHLEERHGGARRYLADAGLSETHQASLGDRLVRDVKAEQHD